MAVKLKKIQEQIIVITGASSGIGLATARMAAERGARVVLCARNHGELDQICDEINREFGPRWSEDGGKRAIAVECDVADPDAVQRVADRAVAEFGRFDTWVNNAGISIYGKLWEVPMEEKKRLFDVNFWGVVNGCRSAVKFLRNQNGGAIINIGSILSERSIPIQGIYSASKHAVKAYTDSLRMELEAEKFPISVSLIKPAAIDTPYTEHAQNHMASPPAHTPPVYHPDVVARAILDCAESPKRDVYVGGSAKFYSLLETFLPRLTDLIMEKSMMERGQSSDRLPNNQSEMALLKVPQNEGRVSGNYPGRVLKRSAYTSAALRPGVSALVATGLGLAAVAGVGWLQARRGENPLSKLAHLGDIVRH